MQLIDYIELAMQKQGFKSYRELSRALGHKSNQSLVFLRKGFQNPSDETMIRLAELAGLSKEAAILRLNIWRSKSPEARELYTALAERLAKQASTWLICTATVAIIAAAPAGSNAYAAENNTRTEQHQYYGGYKLCDKWLAPDRPLFMQIKTVLCLLNSGWADAASC